MDTCLPTFEKVQENQKSAECCPFMKYSGREQDMSYLRQCHLTSVSMSTSWLKLTQGKSFSFRSVMYMGGLIVK